VLTEEKDVIFESTQASQPSITTVSVAIRRYNIFYNNRIENTRVQFASRIDLSRRIDLIDFSRH